MLPLPQGFFDGVRDSNFWPHTHCHYIYSQKVSQARLEPGLTMNVLLYHITNLVSCAVVQHASVPSVPIRSSSYFELLFFDMKFSVQNQKADWLSTHMSIATFLFSHTITLHQAFMMSVSSNGVLNYSPSPSLPRKTSISYIQTFNPPIHTA